MKTVTLKIPDELLERGDRVVKRERISRSELIRRAMKRYLDGVEKKEKGFVSFYDLTKDLISPVGSGIGDLATNPKHMEGFGKSRPWRK